MKLIDKDALVAWAKETYLFENASMIRKVCYKQLLEHLDTLEVKKVDLEKEAERFVQTKEFIESTESPIILIAKHFFELGMQQSKNHNNNEE